MKSTKSKNREIREVRELTADDLNIVSAGSGKHLDGTSGGTVAAGWNLAQNKRVA